MKKHVQEDKSVGCRTVSMPPRHVVTALRRWFLRKERGDAPDFEETLDDGTVLEVTRVPCGGPRLPLVQEPILGQATAEPEEVKDVEP